MTRADAIARAQGQISSGAFLRELDRMVGEWRDGLDPWRLTRIDNRVYGRGTADNKGQHSINLAALRAVREARGGHLGFNVKFIIEMGEEIGSPDLGKVCEHLADE